MIQMRLMVAGIALALGVHTSFGQACGNSNEGGPADNAEPPLVGDPVQVYTGDEFRDIKDLKIWGGVGDHQLVWERWSNSRVPGGPSWFGNGHSWRHGYQWEVGAISPSPTGQLRLQINYPNGGVFQFQQGAAVTSGPEQAGPSPILWQPINVGYNQLYSSGDLLYQNGTDFYLQRANGYVYHITESTVSGMVYYLVTDFYDAKNDQYFLTYNAGRQLIKVTEPGGRYFQINYMTLSLNTLPFSTLASVTAVPAANQWTTLTVTNTKAYRYLRFLSPDSCYGDIADVQFYDTKGNLLTGTPFGTGPASSPTATFAQALDGNPSTYFDSTVPTGNYVGIDLGVGKTAVVGSIKFYPRPGYESRVFTSGIFAASSGVFQGGNQAPASTTVISSVSTSDGRTVTYNYQPFSDPTLPTVFQVLAGATYEDGTQAVYTSQQIEPGTTPLITTYVDPRYELQLSRSSTVYYTGTTFNFGQIIEQLSYGTNQVLQTIGIGTLGAAGGRHNPTSTFANGAVESYYMALPSGRPNGKVDYQIDGLGRKTSFLYGNGGWGYQISVTDALGRVTTSTPSNLGNPLAITYPDGTTASWTRDNKDLVLSITDRLGRVTTYTRDSQHRVTQISYPDGATESFTYNNFSEILTHTLRNGGSESFTYDPTGLLLTKTDAAGYLSKYTYDAYGRVASVTDPLNETTTFTYDTRGHVLSQVNADGSSLSYTYDLFGNELSKTDELGHATTFTYDQFNRLVTVTDPLNRTTVYNFPSNYYGNDPTSVTLPSGRTVAYTYDLQWNKLSQTFGSGTTDAATTSYIYDKGNRVSQITDPNGHAVAFTYDSLDRKLTSMDALGHLTKWAYDSVGNLLTITRPDGGLIRNTYDSLNRLLSTTDPKSETTQFTYTADGDLASRVDAKGDTYGYSYSLLDQVTQATYPDKSGESWTYDGDGDVATYTTRAGQTKTSTYDRRNRETAYTWTDSTPGAKITYDLAGRELSASNGVSTTSYVYDAANELTSETQTNATLGTPWVTSYQYDLDGLNSNVTYPSGLSVAYGYTNRNQVNSIAVGGVPLATYAYDPAGNRLSRSLSNGTLSSSVFDADNNLLTLNHTLSATSYARFDYAYDSVNRRKYEQRNQLTGDVYTYDAIDQVTGVKYDTTNPATTGTAPDRTVAYTFDGTGNRTAVVDSAIVGTTSYVPNPSNEYASVGGLSYSYDGNGNLTKANGSYSYDSQNRLLTASLGTNSDQYFYDSRNRVVERKINGVITYLVYDGWNLIEERNAAGAVLATYVHGVQSDETLSRTSSSGTVYYDQNALGSVVDLTSSTGSVVENYKYDIFGKPAISNASGTILTGSAYGNRFLYAGREFLAEVNLYDYRNRVYSADLGRFLQIDPLRFGAGDINIYRYAGNNVVNLNDPLGLDDAFEPDGDQPKDDGGGDGDNGDGGDTNPPPAPTPPPTPTPAPASPPPPLPIPAPGDPDYPCLS